jgi:hypothetical protein
MFECLAGLYLYACPRWGQQQQLCLTSFRESFAPTADQRDRHVATFSILVRSGGPGRNSITQSSKVERGHVVHVLRSLVVAVGCWDCWISGPLTNPHEVVPPIHEQASATSLWSIQGKCSHLASLSLSPIEATSYHTSYIDLDSSSH